MVPKFQLPIITFLRNPALRPRHWIRIENILNYKFKADETITLSLLEELKVFNYPNEIMDVSGQASSEYSLESLLKRVLFFSTKYLIARIQARSNRRLKKLGTN